MTQMLLRTMIPSLAILIGIVHQHTLMNRLYKRVILMEERIDGHLAAIDARFGLAIKRMTTVWSSTDNG